MAELEQNERLQIGTGNGVRVAFAFQIRQPVIPGSICVRVLPPDAVSRLALLTTDPETMCQDDWPGVIRDQRKRGGVQIHPGHVNYQTGQVHIEWSWPPPAGSVIICDWRRTTHRLRGSKVQVQLPNGDTEWVPLHELENAIALE